MQDSDTRMELVNQLRSDIASQANPSSQIALAWTLTEMVESGVFIDDLRSDICEAQKALGAALILEPTLADDRQFQNQQRQTGMVIQRVQKDEKRRQAELNKARNTDDAQMSAKQAAEIAYGSKEPETVAHYFLLAANKIEDSEPSQATWYLNSRVTALLDLERWDEALPQLQRMATGTDPTDFWIEQGFIGLLRIAAARSDGRAFKRTWKDAQTASSKIPGSSPHYYKVLGFGIESDFPQFVGPVLQSLKANMVYVKTEQDERVFELASNYVSIAANGSVMSKFRKLFNRTNP